MKNLCVEIEVFDFDLETIGFNFNVLNSDMKKSKSTSTVRMSLDELRVFVDALKASAANINLAAPGNIINRSELKPILSLSNSKMFPSKDSMEQEIAAEIAKVARR